MNLIISYLIWQIWQWKLIWLKIISTQKFKVSNPRALLNLTLLRCLFSTAPTTKLNKIFPVWEYVFENKSIHEILWEMGVPPRLPMWQYTSERADSRFAPSQWEMALFCNDIAHWLGTNLESVRLQTSCLVLEGQLGSEREDVMRLNNQPISVSGKWKAALH